MRQRPVCRSPFFLTPAKYTATLWQPRTAADTDSHLEATMTDRPTRRSTRQVDFATETLMSRRRLPGESTPDCDALIEMLRADLNPGTAYEHVICQNLVELELEAASYRRIRDDLDPKQALREAD